MNRHPLLKRLAQGACILVPAAMLAACAAGGSSPGASAASASAVASKGAAIVTSLEHDHSGQHVLTEAGNCKPFTGGTLTVVLTPTAGQTLSVKDKIVSARLTAGKYFASSGNRAAFGGCLKTRLGMTETEKKAFNQCAETKALARGVVNAATHWSVDQAWLVTDVPNCYSTVMKVKASPPPSTSGTDKKSPAAKTTASPASS